MREERRRREREREQKRRSRVAGAGGEGEREKTKQPLTTTVVCFVLFRFVLFGVLGKDYGAASNYPRLSWRKKKKKKLWLTSVFCRNFVVA